MVESFSNLSDEGEEIALLFMGAFCTPAAS